MTDVDRRYNTPESAVDGPADGNDPVPALVDWVLSVVVGVIGAAVAGTGAWMYTGVDRAMIADVVTAEGTELNGISEADAIAAGVPFVEWLAVGFVATGLVSIAGAVWFGTRRRRTRRRVASEGGSTATFWACAVYGAAVSALVSFVPGSAAIGGGVAGRLYDGEANLRTGVASGLIGVMLTTPLTMSVVGGLVAAGSAIDASGGPSWPSRSWARSWSRPGSSQASVPSVPTPPSGSSDPQTGFPSAQGAHR